MGVSTAPSAGGTFSRMARVAMAGTPAVSVAGSVTWLTVPRRRNRTSTSTFDARARGTRWFVSSMVASTPARTSATIVATVSSGIEMRSDGTYRRTGASAFAGQPAGAVGRYIGADDGLMPMLSPSTFCVMSSNPRFSVFPALSARSSWLTDRPFTSRPTS